jgi:hypothetical protein
LFVPELFIKNLLALGKLVTILTEYFHLLISLLNIFANQTNLLFFSWKQALQLFDILFTLQVFVSCLLVALLRLNNTIFELLNHNSQVSFLRHFFSHYIVSHVICLSGVGELVLHFKLQQ